ncbi:hypothetical protein [Streptomyces sp. NBC_01197]|uniref:hypothetical protein n=1 Tax=Streptomyces sp. NBC_01197 TaxID=2903768 RepID=UPI002E0F69B1|nr:hypothetical protein OG452_20970 [Streptomyces sp. NBC_01197]
MTPIVLASACLLLITLGYTVKCWLSPFGDCRRCRGMGYAVRVDRKGRAKRGKDCRRCQTTGKRIRLGRHLYNVSRHTYRAGTH